MAKYNDQTSVFLDALEDKFAALTELVLDMREQMVTKTELEDFKRQVHYDTLAIQAAARAHSYDLDDHERRITRLESHVIEPT